MPVVFVHGVPDTFRVWDEVRGQMPTLDTTALALPGFGCPVPKGFTATKEEYVDWIVERLAEFSEPVDLVGHDWGCLLTARVASLRPELVRTWAGGDGPVSKDYVWHELAQLWQTPGVGEKWMADIQTEPFSQQLQQLGVPAAPAKEAAERLDPLMQDCILRLYRSALTVGADWEPGLAAVTAPSLVFWGKDDQACPIAYADKLGETLHAPVLKLDCGHWTPLQKPGEIAGALRAHWAAAD